MQIHATYDYFANTFVCTVMTDLYKHENQDQHHGGLTLHRLLRTESHYGMVSGLRVINHAMAMCMYVTNLLKLNTDKLVALPSTNV